MSGNSIIGYADPLVVSPGGNVSIKVSSHSSQYTSRLLRLGPGSDFEHAPPIGHKHVQSMGEGTHEGRPQYSRLGSFGQVPRWKGKDMSFNNGILQFQFWCQPTLPEKSTHEQYLFSIHDRATNTGIQTFLDRKGHLIVRIRSNSTMEDLSTQHPLIRNFWYHVTISLDFVLGNVKLHMAAKSMDLSEPPTVMDLEHYYKDIPNIPDVSLYIASDDPGSLTNSSALSTTCFNGKIDSFKIVYSQKDTVQLLLDLDFSLEMSSDHIKDKSGNQHDGRLINAPTRAVTGHDWDASEVDWTRATYGYGAIHFHDDDLDDAAWNTDFQFRLPENFSSGCYAVEVRDETGIDLIPFFVRPIKNGPRKKVAMVMSTFTYTCYANEHIYDVSRDAHVQLDDPEKIYKGPHWTTLENRPDLGISLYDTHNDGSGTVYSSTKRPVMNMRPDYVHWGFGGPREFSADLWFIGFLDRELGEDNYDVITDHDIHKQGIKLLSQYDILISCCHPEYPTYDILTAYRTFLDSGGFFMYLGGNGYYWVTAHDSEIPHRVEVRRAGQGCRAFELPPGCWHHSLTGEFGGLWRARGIPPNILFGLGSAACGMGKGAAFGVTKEAWCDPRVEFVLKRLDSSTDSIVGDFGLVQGAASGDEIDRLDYGLGTPGNAILIATTLLAGGHSDDYGVFNEEVLFPMVNTLGTSCDKVRSDMIYFETASHGAVFSVGSINWVGSMAWRNYENNIAQITRNVLQEFVKRCNDRSLPG